MNKQYDIILIGDSPDGFKALKALASASQTIKIAYVSREFKSTTTRDFLNVEYIKDELVLIDYRTKLFGCYLKSGDRLYSTHIIVASGLKYEPYYVNGKSVPNVFNTPYDISKTAKNLPAVVVGRDTRAIKLAIAVAKKYRHVYLCMDTINPSCSTALKEKIETIDNIVILPNAVITKVHLQKGELTSVEFSNYSQVTCKAIFIKTAEAPETGYIQKNIIAKDAGGYCIVDENSESTLVPKCFAVGSCTVKSTARKQEAMIKTILADFMEV